MGPDLFFPERGQPTDEAKAVCQGCPVSHACFMFAIQSGEIFGIWGGMSGDQRRQIRSPELSQKNPILHDTATGYAAHVRQGIPPCDGCKWAHADYVRRGKYRRINMGVGR
jgi:hypothetical protein